MNSFQNRKLSYGLGVVWILLVGIGIRVLMIYKGAEGPSGTPPGRWPADAHLSLSAKPYTLLMFAHPRCPCTKASLGELEILISKANETFDATVLFIAPEGSDGKWENSGLRLQAKAIPNVKVVSDTNSDFAKLFHVETSGHTLVYNSEGRLIFSGGITASRGHLGNNMGLEHLLSLQGIAKPAEATTPVFGCGLFNESCETAESCHPQ